MINQAKSQLYRMVPKYKYGYEVARNYLHGLELEKRNSNTKWSDANKAEMDCMHSYSVFEDKGHGAKIPEGYKKI